MAENISLGQGPRPRLVGEVLHLPVERRHGRSAPLTLRVLNTLTAGGWGCFSPSRLPRGEQPQRAAGGAFDLLPKAGFGKFHRGTGRNLSLSSSPLSMIFAALPCF